MARQECDYYEDNRLYQTTTLLTTSLAGASTTNAMSLQLPKGTYIATFSGRRDEITASRIFLSIHNSSLISGGNADANKSGFSMTYIFTLTQTTTIYAKMMCEGSGTINGSSCRFQAYRLN